MKKAFAVVILSLLLLGGAFAGAPPIKSLDDLEGVPGSVGYCEEVSIVMGNFDRDGSNYQLWFSPSTKRFVLAVYDSNDDPIEIWYGSVKDNKFDIKLDLPFVEAQKQFPSPCDWLILKEA
jgi:hypothetical protein